MALLAPIPAPPTAVAAARILVLRNFIVYRSEWKLFLTGFLEPVLYLFSIGIGVGQLIETFEFHGEAIPYATFVAPAMLATSAFNGALLDSTFNVFFKLRGFVIDGGPPPTTRGRASDLRKRWNLPREVCSSYAVD